jgi:hypothetical protein
VSLAERLDDGLVIEEMGTVVSTGPELGVRTDTGDRHARRAASCLTPPQPGDLVLLATSARGDCYLLAVLERREGAETEIGVDGDLAIRARSGRVTIAAQQGVDLVSAADVSVAAGRFELVAAAGQVVLDQLGFVGERVRAEVAKVKLFARTFDAVLERFSERVKRSYRTVEEQDQLRAEQIDYRAERTMCLRAENTVMTARELVKVDGEQIHLG